MAPKTLSEAEESARAYSSQDFLGGERVVTTERDLFGGGTVIMTEDLNADEIHRIIVPNLSAEPQEESDARYGEMADADPNL